MTTPELDVALLEPAPNHTSGEAEVLATPSDIAPHLTPAWIPGESLEAALTPDEFEIAFQKPPYPQLFELDPEIPDQAPQLLEHTTISEKPAKGRCSRTIQRGRVFGRAVREDWQESTSKPRTVGAGAIHLVTRWAGRSQLAAIGMANVTWKAFEATHSTLVTAGAAMLTATAWARLATGAMNQTIKHYPNTYRAAGDSLPKLNEKVAKTLPGFTAYTDKGLAETNKLPSARRRGKHAITFIMLAFSAASKVTPYMSAAGRASQTSAERRRLAWALSIASGAARAGIFAVMAQTTLSVSHRNPELAERIQNYVKSPVLWAALGGVVMAGTFTKNTITERHNRTRVMQLLTPVTEGMPELQEGVLIEAPELVA